jgi:hypothetical protein
MSWEESCDQQLLCCSVLAFLQFCHVRELFYQLKPLKMFISRLKIGQVASRLVGDSMCYKNSGMNFPNLIINTSYGK